MQHVNDTILFLADDESQLFSTRLILELLEEVTGLKVNFNKSLLVGMNLEDRPLQSAKFLLGCQIGDFPLSYFGLPLSPGALLSSEWQSIVKR